MKHTPGPWAVSAGCHIRADKTVPVLIATINNSDNLKINGHNWEANLHLVSAAPELLEAVKAFMSLGFGRYKTGLTSTDIEVDAIFDQGAKVLAKAKGELA